MRCHILDTKQKVTKMMKSATTHESFVDRNKKTNSKTETALIYSLLDNEFRTVN